MSRMCARAPTITEASVRAGAIGAAVVFLLAIGPAAAAQDKAAKDPVVRAARATNWTDAAALRRVFTGADIVKRFLNEIANDGDLTAPDMVGDVREFRFVDLDGDGWLELAALAGDTGRNVSCTLACHLELVFDRPGRPVAKLETAFEGFVAYELSGFDVANLDAILRDFNGDGTFEIVLPEILGPYPGGTVPISTMPEVYAWTGNRYTKVSASFPAFYRDEVLPRLERELEQFEMLPTPNEAVARADLRAKRDMYAREIAEARKRANPKQR